MSRFKGMAPGARHEEHMQHLDEGTIHAWLDGALAAEQAAEVERHVRDCADCAAMVADARGMIAGAARIVSALDDVPAGVIPKQPAAASRSLWRTLHLTPLRAALAASLMVAAASLAVIRHAPLEERSSDSRLRAPSVQLPPAVPAPAVAPALAPAATPAPTVAAPKATSFDRKLESVAQPPRGELAKQAPPASAPRDERQEKVAAALDSTKAKAAADSAASLAAGFARTTDTTRAASQVLAEAARRSAAPVAGAAPPVAPATNAVAAREVSQRNSGLKLTEVVTTGASSLTFMLTSDNGRPLALPGCYQIVRDSLGAAVRLPDRFSLDIEPGVQRNIVRGLTQDGRRDSVITGITWRPAPGGDRFVLISSVAQPGAVFAQTPAAKLKQDAANSAVRDALGSAVASARLSRVDCR
jgi:hypothetical protein